MDIKILEGILPDVMVRSLKRLAIILWFIGLIHILNYFYFLESFPPEFTASVSIYSLLIGIGLLGIVIFILGCVLLPSFIFLSITKIESSNEGVKSNEVTKGNLIKDFFFIIFICMIFILIFIILTMSTISYEGNFQFSNKEIQDIQSLLLYISAGFVVINIIFSLCNKILMANQLRARSETQKLKPTEKKQRAECLVWLLILAVVYVLLCAYISWGNDEFNDISKYSIKKLGIGNQNFNNIVFNEEGCSAIKDYLGDDAIRIGYHARTNSKSCKIGNGRIISSFGNEYYIDFKYNYYTNRFTNIGGYISALIVNRGTSLKINNSDIDHQIFKFTISKKSVVSINYDSQLKQKEIVVESIQNNDFKKPKLPLNEGQTPNAKNNM